MKNTIKKMSMLIAVMVVAVVCFAFSASAATEGYYTYEISKSQVTITSVDQSISGDVTIPATLGGYPVRVIGDRAFFNHENLTSVTIPDSVTTIGDDAFCHCNYLTNVTIPKSVTTIGDDAFRYGDSLTSITVDSENPAYSSDSRGVFFNKDKTVLIQYPERNTATTYTIPESVTTIGDSAFYACRNLTSVTIPKSVTTIGEYAFIYCNYLTNVTIPKSVTSIGDKAFYYCSSLTGITVDSENTAYSSDSRGVFFNKDKTVLIKYPTGNTATTYTIPETVITIGNSAFRDCCNLTSVTIPESVITIGDNAFYYCRNLTSVTIPDSVTTISYGAFDYCYDLTSVTISKSVTTIDDSAPFRDCTSLTGITVDPENPAYSSDSIGVLFNKDKTVLIKYPQANTAKSYAIPNGVKTIGEFAFEDCDNLTSVTIPDSVTTIVHGGFYDCNNLKSITIPEGVTTINDSAFSCCSSLTNVTIPYSVTTIDYGAFRDCSSLTDVYYGDSEQQWNKISIVPDDNAALNNATIHYHYHDCTSAITTPSTHLINGIRTYNCKNCGYSYTEPTEKLPEHSYVASQTSAPTCEEKGYTVYVCECGSSYRGNITAANGHNYEGDKCKVCGENKIDNCTCNCHKGGISGFFWKILRFFYKLLGTNKTCACGVSHY